MKGVTMKKKRTIRFRIASTKPKHLTYDFKAATSHVVQCFKDALEELTPLVIHDHMPIGEAVVLIASYGHTKLTGKNTLSLEDIQDACHAFVYFLKHGKIRLSEDFPYTVQQVLSAMEDSGDER